MGLKLIYSKSEQEALKDAEYGVRPVLVEDDPEYVAVEKLDMDALNRLPPEGRPRQDASPSAHRQRFDLDGLNDETPNLFVATDPLFDQDC